MHRTLLISLTVLVLSSCTDQDETPRDVTPQNATPQIVKASATLFEKHVTYLASDELLGREPGTEGYAQAAKYVADELASLGVTPAGGDGSFYQQVPLRKAQRVKESIELSVVDAAGNAVGLIQDVDYAIGGSSRNKQVDISAPLVFAGYGLVIDPENRDDYADIDVTGKVVAVISNTPSHIQSEERAYYGAQKSPEASNRGAIGYVSFATPVSEGVFPFTRAIEGGMLDLPSMSWIKPDGDVFSRSPNIRGGAFFSLSGAKKIVAAAGRDWDAIIEASQTDLGVTPTFETGLTINIKGQSSTTDIESPNVAGVVPGIDPTLKHEVVVLTAHLDHLGVSPIDAEDKINNGALDNAAGVATLIEAARLLQAGPPPRRTVMFLAVTAEEQGLLGAQYFAKYPTVAKENIVANINLDMPVLTYDFQDVIVFGGTRSTLKQSIEQAAESMGIDVSPDPFPEQGIFTRSDHYRFVEEGVPSVMLSTGFANGGDVAFTSHLQTHYHQPSDDLNLPIDWDAGAKFADLKAKVLLSVANADERPLWHACDFFGTRFNGPMDTTVSAE